MTPAKAANQENDEFRTSRKVSGFWRFGLWPPQMWMDFGYFFTRGELWFIAIRWYLICCPVTIMKGTRAVQARTIFGIIGGRGVPQDPRPLEARQQHKKFEFWAEILHVSHFLVVLSKNEWGRKSARPKLHSGALGAVGPVGQMYGWIFLCEI